jgi:hypothetical protein
MVVIYGFSEKAGVFVPDKPSQPSLMFADNVKAYLSEAPFRCSTRRPLDLSTNIRLSWNGSPGTNTLANYENPQITTVNSFIGFTPGAYPKGAPQVNIKPAPKNLSLTNALAYFARTSQTTKKKFYNLDASGPCYKTFLSVIYECS